MAQAYAVFCGVDVGKGEHHAVGLDTGGKRLFDKALSNDEARLRAVFDKLAAHGPLLIVVDQPNTIGALPVTVARACGHAVAYLPGLSMRRIADLYPGQAKTDARDAYIIADAARTMPHTLRRVDTGDEALTELGVLVGFDDDLAGEATRTSNRIRGLLTSIHPALERVLRHASRIQRCWRSCLAAAGPPESGPPGAANSPRSRSNTPRAWVLASSRKSWPRCPRRRSPFPAPTLPR